MSERSCSRLINFIRSQGSAYNPPSISLGIILSDNPLTIKIGDQQVDKDNILVADFLMSNNTRKVNISNGTASGSTSDGSSISSISISNADITFTDGLKKDDIVACLATEDRQTYIVLCRVVNVQ